MKRYRIFIGTTQGAAAVQRIAAEDPQVRSVICLNGTCEALPISADYDAFVRQPTGVIQRQFGHAVYRVDVDRPITSGKSWQLGLFTAHILFAKGLLAKPDETADGAVWLTGEVDRDLQVRPVAQVPEKLRTALPLFDQLHHDGIPLIVALPRENAAQLHPDLLKKLTDGYPQRQIVALTETEQLLPLLQGGKTAIRRYGKIALRMTALLIPLLLALAGYGLWQWGPANWNRMIQAGAYPQLEAALQTGAKSHCFWCQPTQQAFQAWLTAHKPDKTNLVVSARESRAPASTNCAALYAAVSPPLEQAIPLKTSAAPTTTPARGLCRLVYTGVNPGQPLHAGLFVVANGILIAPLSQSALTAQSRRLDRGQEITLPISDLPQRLKTIQRHQVVAVLSHHPLQQIWPWITASLPVVEPKKPEQIAPPSTKPATVPQRLPPPRLGHMVLTQTQRSRIHSLDDFSGNRRLPRQRPQPKKPVIPVKTSPPPTHSPKPPPQEIDLTPLQNRLQRLGVTIHVLHHTLTP